MTRKKRLKFIGKFADSCDRPLSTPRKGEAPSQERHRLLTDILTRIAMFIDARLYARGERARWMRLYWETASKVHEARDEIARRCIEEGRQ